MGAAVAAGGCGSDGPGKSDLDAPCNDRLGKPLKAQDVIAALEAEGFTPQSHPISFYCNPSNFAGGGAAIADVSNRRDLGDQDGPDDREGWMTCNVYRSGGGAPYELYADLNRGPDSPIYAGTKSVFALANVDCSHYPPDSNARMWQARAHAAMKRLERQLATDDY